jgi:hypothetical protein
MLNLTGVTLALYVFMADTLAAAPRGLQAICNVVPEKFNWPLFSLAFVLMGMPTLQLAAQCLFAPQKASAPNPVYQETNVISPANSKP